MLDLDCEIRPCPKDGRFRKEVLERGGKETFPYFVDETSGKEMYESADIVNYLYEKYGNGRECRRIISQARSSRDGCRHFFVPVEE